MKENYICYDGVDGDVTYWETEEEALAQLKAFIEEGQEDGEWIDFTENSFVAKISHYIDKVKRKATDEGLGI